MITSSAVRTKMYVTLNDICKENGNEHVQLLVCMYALGVFVAEIYFMLYKLCDRFKAFALARKMGRN